MSLLSTLLALVIAVAICALGFTIGTWVYFKLEDLYYFIKEKVFCK